MSSWQSRGFLRGMIARRLRRLPKVAKIQVALFQQMMVCTIRLKMKELILFLPSLDGNRELSLPIRFFLLSQAFPYSVLREPLPMECYLGYQ
jgi:hypothetical protein